MNKHYKQGMKDLLNKLYFKLPKDQAGFIIAEANDLSKWSGAVFFYDEKTDQIKYRSKKAKADR